jgi:4'-phosphopantetheinyl transferase
MILGSNEVHVWRASLDDHAPQRDSFLRTLTAEELRRAARSYFQRGRERFVAAHGILRAILGLYLKKAPQCLSLSYSSNGKPALTGESAVCNALKVIHFGVTRWGWTAGRWRIGPVRA